MAREKLGFMDYVKEAFNLKVKVPAMGKVPVNWLGLTGIGVVSFFFPPFLLIGTGMELGYLYLLSTSPRFQKYVQAVRNSKTKEQWEEKKNRILARLSGPSKAKYDELEAKCRKVVSIYEAASLETGRLDTSRVIILNQILWTALRLLLSRGIIVRNIKNESKEELQKKIEKMEQNLKNESSQRLQKTLQSTIEIMNKRLQNIEAADEKLKSIDLELMRIEEQLELLSNVAAMEGQGEGTLSEKIDSIATSINETDEWMKTDRELFGALEEEFEGPPEGIIDPGSASAGQNEII
jgi:macrodomain Ter protein organizer (MatP/YcbG family)